MSLLPDILLIINLFPIKVERESIDLVDKTLAIYNEELLSMAGILTRIVYEEQMDQLSRFYTDIVNSKVYPDDKEVHTARELIQKKSCANSYPFYLSPKHT